MLDAKHVGNEGRMINHFRGIAREGNVRFRTRAHPSRGIWVDIIATCTIADGEESALLPARLIGRLID